MFKLSFLIVDALTGKFSLFSIILLKFQTVGAIVILMNRRKVRRIVDIPKS